MKSEDTLSVLLSVLLIIGGFGPWLTHIWFCLQNDSWGFLIAGAIFIPIGWLHGMGIWLGFF
jgi:hypothetical protein